MRVMQDCAFWTAYNCPFDARRVLPAREYLAHLAILRGRVEKAEADRIKAEQRT